MIDVLVARAFSQLSDDTTNQESVHMPPQNQAKSKGTRSGPVPTAKLKQTWSRLWNEWADVVEEAAQEEGKYITQEAQWEPPYFDETAFVEDLEKVAKQMRPLLRAAFENRRSPDAGFARALLNAEKEIEKGLPDWMEITDGFYLEKNLTVCLLEWEWMKAQAKGQDAFAFARCILDWEDKFAYVALDDDALLDFFGQLPEADQKAVHEGLAGHRDTPPWRKCLKDTGSHWHALYMYYAETRAPEQYLDSLRATIFQQWQNGLPVIEALLAKEDYQQSLRVIEKTLSALLAYHHRGQSWTPETALLFTLVSGFYHSDIQLRDHKKLLRYYQQTVRGLGQAQQVKVLEIQQTALNHFFDWERMFRAFEETSVPGEIRQALFHSWRDHIAQRTRPHTWGFGLERTHDTWWLHWLIESIFDSQKGPAWFQEKMDEWLKQLPDRVRSSGDEDFNDLRLLTKDVMALSNSRKEEHPYFRKVVIRTGELSTPDDKSQQKYLKAYAPRDILDRVMAYWKGHLHDLVPNPREVQKSDYTEHAWWMAALKELAPRSYQVLLKKWRVEHERRPNLWQAMEKTGLR